MTWDKSILLKFPGNKEYDFQRPWVFNQGIDGILYADLFIYVDGRNLNWSVNRNGIILDPFKWRVSCVKCRKKVVKVAGIFCGKFFVGPGNTLHARWCDAKVVTSNIQRMTSLIQVNSLENIGKESWKVDIIRGGQEITCSQISGVICAILET